MNYKRSNKIVVVLSLIYLVFAFGLSNYYKETKAKENGDWSSNAELSDEVISMIGKLTPKENGIIEEQTKPVEENINNEQTTYVEENINNEQTTYVEENINNEQTTLVEENINNEQTTLKEENTSVEQTTSQPQSEYAGSIKYDMSNSLFIGDSRTDGLRIYSGMNEAVYFANTGMSVYNIGSARVDVNGIGNVSVDEILAVRQFDNIFLMLGINEIGYSFDKTVERYVELVMKIREAQPQAKIIIQANMHVTKSKSQSDSKVNNPSLNAFNSAISMLANGYDIFYIDANPLFDDGEGNLPEDMSFDTVHMYAKHYVVWADWIREQTGIINR